MGIGKVPIPIFTTTELASGDYNSNAPVHWSSLFIIGYIVYNRTDYKSRYVVRAIRRSKVYTGRARLILKKGKVGSHVCI